MIFAYLFICLISAGFFAGMETGLLAVNRMLIQSKNGRSLFARASEFLLVKPERLLGTTLIGHNIANVTAAVLVTNHFESIGLPQYTWIGIIVMAFVFLVFDDFIPKSFLRQHANSVAAKLAPVVVFFYALFLPVYLVLNTLVKVLIVFTGNQATNREEVRTRRDLRFLVNLTGKEAGLPGDDQRIIEDILHFRDQIAREAMIPFHKLPVFTKTQSIDDIINMSVETGRRFFPVSQDRTDNAIGYVDTNDLLINAAPTIAEALRPIRYFPETLHIPDLLLEMNREKLDVVFLVDEYGGISGMITPNQIVADVVRYTPEDGTLVSKIVMTSPGHYRVDAEVDLEDLVHELGIILPQSVNRTAGGYLSERLGRIPAIGEVYEEAGHRFTVVERTDRYIEQIDVERLSRAAQARQPGE